MRRWGFVGLVLLLAGSFQGCGDRLADMQSKLAGAWVLESRQLSDGTVLRPPQVSGVISWMPASSRKAYVTLSVLMAKSGNVPRRFDYAASTYEISTSAITQARHLLIRQGYRSSAKSPISVYPKGRKAKGKISVGDTAIEISHDIAGNEQSWVFEGGTMTASYEGAWVDTWRKIQ